MLKLSQHDRTHIAEILKPSWLSGLVAIGVGLAITVGVIVAFSLHSSNVQLQLEAWQHTQPQRTLTTPDQELEENDRPTLQGSWPLIVVWSLIGLVTYTIAIGIIHTLTRAADLKKSLSYVNAKPLSLLAQTAEHFLLRGLAAGIFVGLLVLFFKRIIPYGITAAHASAADVISIDGLLDASLAFTMIALSLHIQTVFLRLSFGKSRLFG